MFRETLNRRGKKRGSLALALLLVTVLLTPNAVLADETADESARALSDSGQAGQIEWPFAYEPNSTTAKSDSGQAGQIEWFGNDNIMWKILGGGG